MHKAITILYTTCYLDVSGVTRINFDILSRLSSAADIHICTTGNDGKISCLWDDRFVSAFRQPFKLWSLPSRTRYGAFVKYLQSNNIDIIFVTHSLWLYEHVARLKRDLPSIRVVDSLHVLEPYCFRGGYPDISANRFVHPFIDASILISRNIESYLLKNYHVSRNKLHVIHNGIDTVLFNSCSIISNTLKTSILPTVTAKTLGFIGRFTEQKRPLFFVRIACDLIARNPDLGFYMVGCGPLSDEVSKEIKRHGLEEKIMLLSSQSNVALLLHETDVLLLPSSYEGAPLTILEALAAGTPVVASDVGAIREYVGDLCRLIPLGGADVRERQQYVMAVNECLAEGRNSGVLKPEHDITAVAASYKSVFYKVAGLERP